MKPLEYMPALIVDGQRFQMLSMSIGIDWGGRDAECEFQNAQSGECLSATYYYLTDEWSREDWPVDDPLTRAIRNLYAQFDIMKERKERSEEAASAIRQLEEAERQAFSAGWKVNAVGTDVHPQDYLDGCEEVDWQEYRETRAFS